MIVLDRWLVAFTNLIPCATNTTRPVLQLRVMWRRAFPLLHGSVKCLGVVCAGKLKRQRNRIAGRDLGDHDIELV
jgi:hypothetical protein